MKLAETIAEAIANCIRAGLERGYISGDSFTTARDVAKYMLMSHGLILKPNDTIENVDTGLVVAEYLGAEWEGNTLNYIIKPRQTIEFVPITINVSGIK
jgi:hypothetical protein